MRNTKWIYKQNANANLNLENVNENILNILANRGITDEKEIVKFLHPSLDDIKDPYGLSDVEIAVNRIISAVEKQELIYIYGDYDVDGITSTSVGYLALKKIGANVKYYIPLRDEGYGVNNDALTAIAKEGGKILITVDCGITSLGEIAHGKSLGLDMIITDHHDIVNGLSPDAFAIINPKRSDNIYSFKSLAGVGTIFMLMYALYIKLNRKKEIFDYLDLVAVGTIADIVTLTDDNRIFVKYGLSFLGRSKSPGFRELLRNLFFEDFNTRNFTTSDVGFLIAPIFNAAGRLEDAKTSVELLISEDKNVYTGIIQKLIENNTERKKIQEAIQEKAFEMIEEKKLYDKNLILVASKDFHHGVMGIVASKILDKFYKPAIIVEINEKEQTAKGSCRSTESFNMIEALSKFSHYFFKFGGHHGAAGFTMPLENLEKFYEDVEKYCSFILQEGDDLRPIKIESEIPIYSIAYDLINNLELLEPYGYGNPTPLFSITKVEYRDIKVIGKTGAHLTMTLIKDGVEIKNCVFWNSADFIEEIASTPYINVAFRVKMEPYKNKFYYKIYIEDIKPYDMNIQEETVAFNHRKIIFPIKTIIYSQKRISPDIKGKISFFENMTTVALNNNKSIGFIDNQTSYLLKQYHEATKENFAVKVDKLVENDENINIYISIFRDFSFETYAIKDSQLFFDIKNYLIKEKEYSDFQKNILRTVFAEKQNFEIDMPYCDEIEIVILTILIYNSQKNIKTQIVSDIFLSDKIKYFADVNSSNSEGYNYLISIKSNKIKLKRI